MPSARVRSWGADPGVVQLALLDQDVVPQVAEIRDWLRGIEPDGVHTVRTSALFPAAADRFAAAGFTVADQLALLSIDLRSTVAQPAAGASSVDDGAAITAPLRRHHHRAAALVDRAAFGLPWANDADDLEEIRTATPTHHAAGRFLRAGRVRRDLVGFAITGAAAGQGYLQRLAVAPDHHGRGHGRALAVDALDWMRRRGLRTAVVNTGVSNTVALALYTSLGFRLLSQRLVVMQRRLDTP